MTTASHVDEPALSRLDAIDASSRVWSLDAWVMVHPASAFRFMAALPWDVGFRIGCRRPLFVAFGLGCAVSLVGSGTLTARLVGPTMLYWAFVPAVEVLALAAITWRRRRRLPLSIAIDLFFAGHGAWTLFLIVMTGTLAFLPPVFWWAFLTTVSLGGAALVIAWSAYIDFWFFRCVLDASRAAAVRNVVVHRLITWTVVFTIFAVPMMSPWDIVNEIVEALTEVFT